MRILRGLLLEIIHLPQVGHARFCIGDVCECSNRWVGVGIHVLEHLLSLNAPVAESETFVF